MIKTALIRGLLYFMNQMVYILAHPVLGQVEGQTFSVLTTFLPICFFVLPLSAAMVANVKHTAVATRNILFMMNCFRKINVYKIGRLIKHLAASI